ncbi:MAG: phage tail protein [Tannerellaceae bacterium]|nr:phage tail protein [Tannerellaceae bacterium]MCD8263472.1 phage tail protein [Tannerellaceae bacterium]
MANNWDLPVAFYFSVQLGFLELPFKEVSGLQVEMELETIPEGSVNTYQHRLPKQLKHSNLVLKRALRPVISTDVLWIKGILESDFSGSFLPQDIFISLMNEKGFPTYNWICTGAFPIKWDTEALDSQKNSVLIETIEFSYAQLIRL